MPKREGAKRHLELVRNTDPPKLHPLGVGPPLVVRHSEIADFRRCPLKHFIGWTLGYHDPRRESGGKRELGSAWHRMLKVHYELLRDFQIDGEDPDMDWIDERVTIQLRQENPDLQETLAWMYDGYVDEFGPDSDFEILEVEQTLTVPFHDEDDRPLVIWDPRTDQTRPVLYEFTLDILVRSREYRGILVVDNKSTSQPLGQVDIDLSDQFGLYTMASQRRGMKVRGQLINQAKTEKLKRPMTGEERFTRYPSIRTALELRSLELDAVSVIRAMHSENNVRRPYSAPDPRSCGWQCDFKEPHLRMRRMNDPKKLHALLKSHGLEPGATHR